MQKVDLILYNAHILSMDEEYTQYRHGALAVSGDKIVAIGEQAEIRREYEAENSLDCGGKILMPGLVNAHTHVPMTLLRGLADDLRLDVWLMGYMMPVEREFVSPEFCRLGTLIACAEFIKLSRNRVQRPVLFGNISFVGTESLRDTLGGYGEDVFVSQVVPLPDDMSLPLVREYQRAMRRYQHDVPLTFVSFEGYVAGKLFARIAGRIEGVVTREKFITTMQEVGTFDLGGLVLQFGPGDHQGLDTIYLTRIYPVIKELEDE